MVKNAYSHKNHAAAWFSAFSDTVQVNEVLYRCRLPDFLSFAVIVSELRRVQPQIYCNWLSVACPENTCSSAIVSPGFRAVLRNGKRSQVMKIQVIDVRRRQASSHPCFESISTGSPPSIFCSSGRAARLQVTSADQAPHRIAGTDRNTRPAVSALARCNNRAAAIQGFPECAAEFATAHSCQQPIGRLALPILPTLVGRPDRRRILRPIQFPLAAVWDPEIRTAV